MWRNVAPLLRTESGTATVENRKEVLKNSVNSLEKRNRYSDSQSETYRYQRQKRWVGMI